MDEEITVIKCSRCGNTIAVSQGTIYTSTHRGLQLTFVEAVVKCDKCGGRHFLHNQKLGTSLEAIYGEADT
jgi:hypothetical protein